MDTDEDFWITPSTRKRAECEARKSEEGRDEENSCLAGLLDDVEVEKRIQEKLIMERTGHRSLSSLHQYQSIPAEVKEKVSDILQGNLDTFVDGVEEPKRKKLCSEKSELSNEQSGEGVSGNCVV